MFSSQLKSTLCDDASAKMLHNWQICQLDFSDVLMPRIFAKRFWAAIEDMPFKRSSFALILSTVQILLSAKLPAETGTNMARSEPWFCANVRINFSSLLPWLAQKVQYWNLIYSIIDACEKSPGPSLISIILSTVYSKIWDNYIQLQRRGK